MCTWEGSGECLCVLEGACGGGNCIEGSVCMGGSGGCVLEGVCGGGNVY